MSHFSFLRKPFRTSAITGVLLVAGLSSCGSKEGPAAKPGARPVPVTVTAAVQKDVPVEIDAVGTAEAVSTVQVMPQVGGLVQEVHFKEGDFVKKGALLFSIDTRPYQASLAAAQAELVKSNALADQAHQDLERFGKLAAEGVATQLDLSQKRANAAAMDATLAANRAAIASTSINVQYATIRAPIDGRTGSLLVHAGNVVRATDTRALVTIRTIAPIYVRFAVPEQFLPRVQDALRAGPVAVSARPRGDVSGGETGALTFVENSVDSASGKIDMKGVFLNDDQGLWPGQLVDVVVRLSVEKGALVVPESAVQVGQDGAYTFVVGDGKKAELRHIVTSRTVASEVVVSKGLAAGERVVTDGQVRLRDGTDVTVKAPLGQPSPSAAAPVAEGTPR
jgi:multidrug efflux system membrane fusion protein